MQLKKLVEFSAAGAGKTFGICKEAIELSEKHKTNSLIVTYTNKGKEAVESEFKKQNGGVLSPCVAIKTWYDFLLSELVKPYQNFFLKTNEVKGIDFDKLNGFINKAPNDSRNRYIENNGNLYPNEISKLAMKLNSLSGGLVLKRLCEIYGAIFFDEIQDLAGFDLDLIEMIMEESISIKCVGDFKQATYKTNNSQRNRSLSGKNCIEYFKELRKQNKCEISFNLVTRRCNSKICDFANALYPTEEKMVSNNETITGHDGVFAIVEQDIPLYFKKYNPQMLVYDKNSNNYGYPSLNYGICKGLTFERVIIVPNGPFLKYIEKNQSIKNPEKYYVAVTRAKFSVTFIIPSVPSSYKELVECEIDDNKFTIYCLV